MRKLQDDNDGDRQAHASYGVDPGLALIVASSPVTRIVVSRIAELAGLRTCCQTPEEAQAIIAGRLPAIVLLSGGANGHEGDHLLQQLAEFRNKKDGKPSPRIILLTSSNARHPHRDMVDMVVAKPITTERLQPLIRDLIDRLEN